MTESHVGERNSLGQQARRPGRDHLVTGGGIIQESLGAIIPLQTGAFVGIGKDENAKLKKIVADLSLDREMLQDVIRRKL